MEPTTNRMFPVDLPQEAGGGQQCDAGANGTGWLVLALLQVDELLVRQKRLGKTFLESAKPC